MNAAVNIRGRIAAPVSVADMLGLVESLTLIGRDPEAIVRSMVIVGATVERNRNWGNRPVKVGFGGVEARALTGAAALVLFWMRDAREFCGRAA